MSKDNELENALLAIFGTMFIGILIAGGIVYYMSNKHDAEKQDYCGTVIANNTVNIGHKVQQTEPHIVFYCPKLKRNIDVKVSWNTYANFSVNDPVCFRLHPDDTK